PHGRTRQPVCDVRWNGQGPDGGVTKLKFGYRPKHDIFPGDADGFPRDKEVPAKRSKHAHDSNPKPRRADTQRQNAPHAGPEPHKARLATDSQEWRYGLIWKSRHKPKPA